MIKLWLQQQGKDIYSTGLKLNLWTATLDHVTTFASGGVTNEHIEYGLDLSFH